MTHTNRRLAWRLYRLGWIDTPDPVKAERVAARIRGYFAELARVVRAFAQAAAAWVADVARAPAPVTHGSAT